MFKIKNVTKISSLILSIACLLFSPGPTGANTLQKLLHIDCDGALTISSADNKPEYIQKYRLGDVARGMLHGRNFFAIADGAIITTDLKTGKRTFLISGKISIDTNYKPWSVGYVDDGIIIFSAQRYNKNVPIDKQRAHYYLYQIDRKQNSIQKIPIEDCGSAHFSAYAGEIYYTNENGVICKFYGGKVQSLGFKGSSPTISSGGKRLAYISFGFIRYGVHIYEFQTKEKKTVLKFGEAWPIIRWSSDSRCISVKKRSDIFSNHLFLIDLLERKNNLKLTESHACNWFFVEQGFGVEP